MIQFWKNGKLNEMFGLCFPFWVDPKAVNGWRPAYL